MTETQLAIQKIVKNLFKNDKGEPYTLTESQCDIFEAVTRDELKWVWISAPTRFGKSDVLSMALLYLAVFHKLKIPIVAGSTEKANKIMEYITQHIADNPVLYDGLLNVDGFSKAEMLKIKASKRALRWVGGGWIYVTSVDSRNISKEGEGVVGEGGDVVVLEEAGLIRRKEQFSKVVRMVEGDWGKLVMSGNCIENSVFEDAFNDPIYHKVHIKLDQAIGEGRIDEVRLANQKSQTTSKDWKRYYLVEFPSQEEFAFLKPKKYNLLPPLTALKIIGAVDLAIGGSDKGSLVAIVVLGKHTETGQVYEVDSIVETLTPDETIRAIFNLPYKFTRLGIESVAFQRYLLDVVKKKSKQEGKYIPFKGINQNRDKMSRIESMEPYINTNQILFKGDNVLWEEMMEFPKGDHVDGLDALEMAWRLVSSTPSIVSVKSKGR